MFWFNGNKYDFWPVYHAIQKYYPIGISMDESHSSLYSTYPGRKALGELFDDNHFNGENFEARWGNFTERIQAKTQKEVFQTTHPQAPCFSATVNIEETQLGDVIRTKELLVFVSLLGPFYTIIGQNKTGLIIAGNQNAHGLRSDRHYPAVHYLVVSPEGEYAETFNLLCQMIEDRFTGYRFVPFYICKSIIPGLELPCSCEKSNSVFKALTSYNVDFHIPVIGEESFKADDWIIDGYVDDGRRWYAFPPSYTDEQMRSIIENNNSGNQ